MQIPDSHYVLQLLRGTLDLDQDEAAGAYLGAAAARTNAALQGLYFEHVLHRVVQCNVSRPSHDGQKLREISKVIRGRGPKWLDDVEAFNERNAYWIPGSPNFPDIDSALVHKTTLYAFQTTIKRTRAFKKSRFVSAVVGRVAKQIPDLQVTAVVVYFVHPDTVQFELPEVSEWPIQTRSSGQGKKKVKRQPSCTLQLKSYVVKTNPGSPLPQPWVCVDSVLQLFRQILRPSAS
jgi:hypothetical protein